MYQKNPLAPVAVPKAEYFDAINLDRSLAIYKELLGDATDFTFIIVGSIDIEKINLCWPSISAAFHQPVKQPPLMITGFVLQKVI